MAALLLSCVNEEIIDVASPEPQPEAQTDGGSGLYVPGKAFVYLSEEMAELIEDDLAMGAVRTKSAGLNRTLDDLNVTGMRRVFPHGGEYERRMRKAGLHRWYVVTYSDDIPRTKAENTFISLDGVDLIEPVRRTKINDITYNDLDSKLWGIKNTTNPGFDINVIPVWEQYTTGNPDVIVAVVDSGVEIGHEDLALNTQGVTHRNFLGQPKIDPGEHGTHVAGTIAAVGNNGKGMVGVAGGTPDKPGVKIMSCQIFEPDGSMSEVYNAEAIVWSANNGALISQNSWGYIYDENDNGKIDPNEQEAAKNAVISGVDKDAIDYFIRNAGCDADGNQKADSPMKGGVVIFAAGNDNFSNGAPANYENVIAVGAVAADGTRSDFSNYGKWVDIAAPGTDIYSTVPGDQYKSKNGTSMACPHVSGVAALLVSHFGRLGFTNDMLKDKLLKSATVSTADPSKPVGRLVDVRAAFEYGENVTVDPVTGLQAEVKSNNVELSWTAPKDSQEKPAYGYLILYGTDKDAVEAATSTSFEDVKFVTYTPDAAVGSVVKYTLTGLDFMSTYHVKVISYSYSLNYADASPIVTAATLENNPPVITVSHTGKIEVKAIETIDIPVTFSEPDGHEIEYEYTPGSTADTFFAAPKGGGYILRITGKDAEPGTYKARIAVEDVPGDSEDSSESAIAEVTYTILANQAPEKLKEIDNVLLTSKTEFMINLEDYVADPDDEEYKYVTYDYTISNPAVLHMMVKNNQLVGVPIGYGTTDVELKVRDIMGREVVFNFSVLVKDPANPLSVYPNPVTDFVNIGTLDEAETHVTIVSQTGQTVYDEVLPAVSGYEPAKIDMTSCPPGIYVITVAFGGKEYTQNIVKL